jgi:aspartate carbamoyltransferase catalytic subunit
MNQEQPKHLLSVDDLDRKAVDAILARARVLKERQCSQEVALSLGAGIVGLLFYSSSTRTLAGFWSAAIRLGMHALVLRDERYEPGRMERPESLEDAVRSIGSYCDLLVIRHESSDDMRRACAVSPVPVTNAGADQCSHPSQALIDLFAIQDHFGKVDGLKIGLVGDLAGSRSAQSLASVLSRFSPAEIRQVCPCGLELPVAAHSGVDCSVTTSRTLCTEDLDVVYMAGFPAGDGQGPREKSARLAFALDASLVRSMRRTGIVLCPLPRIDEIAGEVDDLPQARYFSQSADALWVRMALIEAVCEGRVGRVFAEAG